MPINKDGLDTSKPVDFKTIVKVESERKKNAEKKPQQRKKTETKEA